MQLKFKRVNGIVYAGIKPFQGRRKWVSMKTSDMSVAKAIAKESKLFKLQAVESGNALTNLVFSRIKGVDVPKVKDAVASYIESLETKGKAKSTVSQHHGNLNLWMRQNGMADKMTSDIVSEDFKAFYNPNDGTKLATLRLRQGACVSFCEYCFNAGYIHFNPARGCGIDVSVLGQEERTTKSHPPITHDEFAKLMVATAGDEFWNLAILIGWETGLRISDVCLLEKSSIVDNHLRLFTRKTNAFVSLPLAPAIMDAINSVSPPVGVHEAQYLFPREHAQYKLYGAAPFSEQFKRICESAGITGKTFHGLRTAYINRTFIDKDAGILKRLSRELAKQETAALAGHRSTETTDIYLNASAQPI